METVEQRISETLKDLEALVERKRQKMPLPLYCLLARKYLVRARCDRATGRVKGET